MQWGFFRVDGGREEGRKGGREDCKSKSGCGNGSVSKGDDSCCTHAKKNSTHSSSLFLIPIAGG